MKKTNPIRGTVENFVAANGRHLKSEKKKVTLLFFFDDLEKRGPFHPNSIFRQWTSSIREDMIASGTWLKKANSGQKTRLAFVQEYISRLQLKFWKMNEHEREYRQTVESPHDDLPFPFWYESLNLNGIKTFKMIYKMIRVFGLRMKLYCLLRARTYRGMKYRHLLIDSVVAEYLFGKEHMEKAWPYYWARRTKTLRAKMRFCAPLKMSIQFY